MTPLLATIAAALLAVEPATAAPESPPAAAPTAAEAAPQGGPRWTVPAAHAGGFLLGMRLTVSVAWPSAYDPTRWREERDQLRLAFTRPPELDPHRRLLESDGDPWWLNGFGHAYFGAEIYGRTRQCGWGPLAAVLATAATSVAWEYGLEAPYKRPSAVDLVWTPLAGALLGEGRYRLHRWLARRGASPWLLIVVDPLGEGERRLLHTGC
ncbi:MAG TPA: DUF3943 domain-containing protein [Anaeromyxobacteraceae bacterium]|nr:DUF3943 domain-containing protein [Anaeromyxobacteraceae bacterium]